MTQHARRKADIERDEWHREILGSLILFASAIVIVVLALTFDVPVYP